MIGELSVLVGGFKKVWKEGKGYANVGEGYLDGNRGGMSIYGGIPEKMVSREMVALRYRGAYFWLLSGYKRIFDGS